MAPAKKSEGKASGECPQCGGPLGPATEFSAAGAQCLKCGYQVTAEGGKDKEKPSRPL